MYSYNIHSHFVTTLTPDALQVVAILAKVWFVQYSSELQSGAITIEGSHPFYRNCGLRFCPNISARS